MKKYSRIDGTVVLGFLANAISGGEDYGQSFPRSDAKDLSCGLRFIPGEVTYARREGKKVIFVHECKNPCCWYWQFPNGNRSYYWERFNFEYIARANEKEKNDKGQYDNAGPCPDCGNIHTGGGYIKKEKVS